MPRKSLGPKVLLRSEQADGRVAVVEHTVGATFAGPPLHHHDFDEAFYVLEGELTFQLHDGLTRASAGELVFPPAGAPHTLANLSGADAPYLLVCTPAGFERYFDRIAAKLTGTDPPHEARKPFPETIVVGPPIPRDPQR